MPLISEGYTVTSGTFMKCAASNLSDRHVSGRCLCGAVELRFDFLAFWAWQDHSDGEPSRSRALRTRPISAVGGSAPALVKGQKSIARFEDAKPTRSEASAPGAELHCFTRASALRTWSIPRGHSPAAVRDASPAVAWPSRNYRVSDTNIGNRLIPLKGYPGIVWERPKSLRRPRDVDEVEFLDGGVPSVPAHKPMLAISQSRSINSR